MMVFIFVNLLYFLSLSWANNEGCLYVVGGKNCKGKVKVSLTTPLHVF